MYPRTYLVFGRCGGETPVPVSSKGFAKTRKDAVLFVVSDRSEETLLNDVLRLLSSEYSEYKFSKGVAICADDCDNERVYLGNKKV